MYLLLKSLNLFLNMGVLKNINTKALPQANSESLWGIFFLTFPTNSNVSQSWELLLNRIFYEAKTQINKNKNEQHRKSMGTWRVS